MGELKLENKVTTLSGKPSPDYYSDPKKAAQDADVPFLAFDLQIVFRRIEIGRDASKPRSANTRRFC